jgi:hypothetical protein
MKSGLEVRFVARAGRARSARLAGGVSSKSMSVAADRLTPLGVPFMVLRASMLMPDCNIRRCICILENQAELAV